MGMRRPVVFVRRCLRRPASLTDVPMLSRERLRRPELSWTLLREARDELRDPSTPCRLRLMTFCTRPRTLRRRPRRPWLMLPDLQMSSDLSRTTPPPSPRARELLRPPLESLRTVLLLLRKLKVLLRLRRTRFSELSLSLDKSSK